jgi:cell division protein FtsQ
VNLPLISGLNASDLTVFGRPDRSDDITTSEHPMPFQAVMEVLRLGKHKGSVLPNRTIKRIKVDRQIGLTVYAFDRIRAIHLGYSDYRGKYNVLSSLFSYLKLQESMSDFDRIDLNNLQRIVVNPVKLASGPKES